MGFAALRSSSLRFILRSSYYGERKHELPPPFFNLHFIHSRSGRILTNPGRRNARGIRLEHHRLLYIQHLRKLYSSRAGKAPYANRQSIYVQNPEDTTSKLNFTTTKQDTIIHKLEVYCRTQKKRKNDENNGNR